MTRRLPSFDGPAGSQAPLWAIAATLAAVMAGTIGLSIAGEKPEAPEPLSPYEHCIEAANHPVSGFATEVCESLMPDFEHPIVSLRPDDFEPSGCVRFVYRHESPEPVRYCPADTEGLTP